MTRTFLLHLDVTADDPASLTLLADQIEDDLTASGHAVVDPGVTVWASPNAAPQNAFIPQSGLPADTQPPSLT